MNLRVPRPNLEKVEDGGQYDARGIQSGSKDKDLRGEWATAKTLEVRVDNSFRSAPRPSPRSDVIFQHCQGAQKTTTDAENIFLVVTETAYQTEEPAGQLTQSGRVRKMISSRKTTLAISLVVVCSVYIS